MIWFCHSYLWTMGNFKIIQLIGWLFYIPTKNLKIKTKLMVCIHAAWKHDKIKKKYKNRITRQAHSLRQSVAASHNSQLLYFTCLISIRAFPVAPRLRRYVSDNSIFSALASQRTTAADVVLTLMAAIGASQVSSAK